MCKKSEFDPLPLPRRRNIKIKKLTGLDYELGSDGHWTEQG